MSASPDAELRRTSSFGRCGLLVNEPDAGRENVDLVRRVIGEFRVGLRVVPVKPNLEPSGVRFLVARLWFPVVSVQKSSNRVEKVSASVEKLSASVVKLPASAQKLCASVQKLCASV